MHDVQAIHTNPNEVRPADARTATFGLLSETAIDLPHLSASLRTKARGYSAKALAVLIKAKPGNCKFASPGNGAIPHLVGAMFIDAAELKVQHVPYKGAAPMIADLLGGQVDFGVAAVSSVQAHLNAGTLRAVAATGATWVPSLASIPTLEEQGFDVTVGGWIAAIGPARLAPAEVVWLHDALVAARTSPEVKRAMAEQENILTATTLEETVAIFSREAARYAEIVRKAGACLWIAHSPPARSRAASHRRLAIDPSDACHTLSPMSLTQILVAQR